jgi:uncharacterized protein YxjI
MREQMFAIVDDYWIETDGGQPAFKVDGKALRLPQDALLKTPDGDEVLTIERKILSVRDTMEIQQRDGKTVATVKRALLKLLRDRFSIEVEGGEDVEAQATSSITSTRSCFRATRS